MNDLNSWYWNKKLDKVKANLIKHRFAVNIFDNSSDAYSYFTDSISKNESIGLGGSITLDELNIPENLKKKGYNIINYPDFNLPRETVILQRRQSLLSDVFICSSNAITEDGHLVNIDGMSNRVSSIMFGPKRVFIFAGINKIVKDVQAGLDRIKNYTAPQNTKRLNRNNPCLQTGECSDCLSQSRICCNTVISGFQSVPDRINILIIKEFLGL